LEKFKGKIKILSNLQLCVYLSENCNFCRSSTFKNHDAAVHKRRTSEINQSIIIIINGNPEAGGMPLFPSEVDNFNTNTNTN